MPRANDKVAAAMSVFSSVLLLALSIDGTPVDPAVSATEAPPATRYVFALDAHNRPRAGMQNFTTLFRLGFWGKDWLFNRLDEAVAMPRWLGIATRFVEFWALDFPLAIETQTFAHEIYGHGGRAREFGASVTYTWAPPFPYGVTSSGAARQYDRPTTFDEQVLDLQGGLTLEGEQRKLVLLTAYESGAWSHGDSVNYFGWALHMAGYGLLRGPGADVMEWNTVLAQRYGLAESTLQRTYLISSLLELADPMLLYSLYSIFYRFLVHGERSVSVPQFTTLGVNWFVTTHLAPVPWGLEYQVDLIARPSFAVIVVSPGVGFGPGGQSGSLSLRARGIQLTGDVRLACEAHLWRQPGLSVTSEGTVLGNPQRIRSNAVTTGIGGALELTFERDTWLFGLRVGAKTAGVQGVEPIAAMFETSALLGLRLNDPPRRLRE